MYEFPIRYILSRRRPSRSLRAFLFGAIKKLLHLVRSTGQPPPLLLELDQVVLWGCMPCCWSLRGGTSGVAGANKPTSGWTGKTVVALAGEDAQIPGLGPGAIAIEASSSGAPGCLALEPSTSRRKPDPLLLTWWLFWQVRHQAIHLQPVCKVHQEVQGLLLQLFFIRRILRGDDSGAKNNEVMSMTKWRGLAAITLPLHHYRWKWWNMFALLCCLCYMPMRFP